MSTKQERLVIGGAVAALLLLITKFYWSRFQTDIPLGFDPGIYRYLFVKHAAGWPPLYVAPMELWAHGHPLGLFIITSPLIRLGLPVDWLLGWLWNLMPVLLAVTLAVVWWKRERNSWVGVALLLCATLSVPLYDGFFGMYWKTYVALIWMVATFACLERASWWALVTAGMVLITHHQTGLLFALTMGSYWLLRLPSQWRQPVFKRATLATGGLLVVSGLVYLPVWQEAIGAHLQTLMSMWSGGAPAGTFPSRSFYAQTELVILLLGLYGFCSTLRHGKKLTVWHLAVVWSAIFVYGKLFFYQRFFLQLDFFLLPFAATTLVAVWQKYRGIALRALILITLLIQAQQSYRVMQQRQPNIDSQTFQDVRNAADYVPADAYLITLDNTSAAWFRGWLPQQSVAGPGLFTLSWQYQDWEDFLFGTSQDRRRLLAPLEGPVYLYAGPLFYEHYGEQAATFASDQCFEAVPDTPLLKVVCPTL